MFEEGLCHRSFAKIFRALMMSDSSITNRRLAAMFYEEFPNIDGVAVQHIWHWKSPAKTSGHIDDARLDEMLCDLLEKSGYLANG